LHGSGAPSGVAVPPRPAGVRAAQPRRLDPRPSIPAPRGGTRLLSRAARSDRGAPDSGGRGRRAAADEPARDRAARGGAPRVGRTATCPARARPRPRPARRRLGRRRASAGADRRGRRPVVSPRGAEADRRGRRVGGRAARPPATVARDSRPADALGLVLDERRALLQLAARPGAGSRAPLRRRPRALPPARAEPLAQLLAPRGGSDARLRARARLAPPPWPRAARLPAAGRVDRSRRR